MSNQTQTMAVLTAASASGSGSDLDNLSCVGGCIVISITAITGTTPAVTFTVEGRDTVSGVYFPILASAALTATGTTVLRVYPGLTAVANLVASSVIPQTYRVSWAITGTTPAVTATVGASLND